MPTIAIGSWTASLPTPPRRMPLRRRRRYRRARAGVGWSKTSVAGRRQPGRRLQPVAQLDRGQRVEPQVLERRSRSRPCCRCARAPRRCRPAPAPGRLRRSARSAQPSPEPGSPLRPAWAPRRPAGRASTCDAGRRRSAGRRDARGRCRRTPPSRRRTPRTCSWASAVTRSTASGPSVQRRAGTNARRVATGFLRHAVSTPPGPSSRKRPRRRRAAP